MEETDENLVHKSTMHSIYSFTFLLSISKANGIDLDERLPLTTPINTGDTHGGIIYEGVYK